MKMRLVKFFIFLFYWRRMHVWIKKKLILFLKIFCFVLIFSILSLFLCMKIYLRSEQYVCKPMSSSLRKNHFLGDFRFVVFISATCMTMSYSMNHLGQQSKSFCVGFFTPFWFLSLRHVCMPMLSSLNHLGEHSKPCIGLFTIAGLQL